ncbi:MAG: hypothetical protein ABJF23_18360 [Bryobacteraceae bacterium]
MGGKTGHGTHPRTPPQIFDVPQAFKDREKDYKDITYRTELAVVLHVTLFKVVFVKNKDVPLTDWIAKADSVLAKHNFSINYHPTTKVPIPLNYNGGKLNLQTDIAELRQVAHTAFQDNAAPPRLPIIICEFSDALRRGTAGETEINQKNPPNGRVQLADGTTWLPFVLLPSGDPVADNATMVHEMAHACLLGHETSGGDNLNILDDTPSIDRTKFSRNRINKYQVREMAKAYFALPKIVVK